VKFKYNGLLIQGCSAVPLVNGKAACTSTNLPKGTYPIVGQYSGDSKNSAGVAGPITQTIS